jgi:uroporphyrinogen-III synthase
MVSALRGKGVLVTRPREQARGLCESLERLGARPFLLPVMEIVALPESDAIRQSLTRLTDFDLLVFVSVNAVDHFARLTGRWKWPGMRVAAVGRATEKRLRELGVTVQLRPSGRSDSDGLLALPELQGVGGWRVLIVRGQGGLQKLAQVLQERGALVDFLELYRRALPDRENVAGLLANWHEQVQLVTLYSRESLDNLVAMLGDGGLPLLLRTPLLTVSERVADAARAIGMQRIRVADSAEDEAMLEAVLDWEELGGCR